MYARTRSQSSHRSAVQWADAQSNLDRTTAVLLKFAQMFSQPQYTSVVTSIQVLNEPASTLRPSHRYELDTD